ncbi:hypothetical protein scyTo_0018976, partial [Scyliorhinus torazame]|nr:hypothetical protein [Scyliorhinus torazame]
ASSDEKKKELLPTGWNANQELYTLRYSSDHDQKVLLLKAITVDSSLIINVMNCQSEQVVDLTVNLNDYISSDHLQQYDRVFKKEEELRRHIESTIVSPLVGMKQRAGGGPQKGKKPVHPTPGAQPHRDTNPFSIPPNAPQRQRQPPWSDPMAPFVSGGDDLDPFGYECIYLINIFMSPCCLSQT